MYKYAIRGRLVTAWLIFGSLGAIGTVMAQVTFTPITEGPLVEDTGNFLAVNWGDYDNDGFVDVVVSNAGSGNTINLYHNDGEDTFSRVTEGDLVTDPVTPITYGWADQDNDGDLDLFVSTGDFSNTSYFDAFYRNEGNGVFKKITEGTWVNRQTSGSISAWGDYDNDGYVDLYLANEDGPSFLYHNNGDGTMESVSTEANNVDVDRTIGALWSDYDDDGDVDLFLAGRSEVQFRNDGAGIFTWINPANGGIPATTASQGVALSSADYDNDGDLDLLYTTWGQDPSNMLYRNKGVEGYEIATGVIPSVPGHINGMGSAWGDYDNDGHQDLFIANESGNNRLYHNEGDGSFTRILDSPVVSLSRHSGSCTWVDYDNDGDLDLFVANGFYSDSEQSCELFRNDDEGTNNWIVLNLVGTVSNRSAIGAKVWAEATIDGQEMTQLREIHGSGNGNSQTDTRVHFGLGDAATVDTLTIEWPSGAVQVMKNVTADQFLSVTEMNMGGRLANISTRGQVGTGDGVLIAGLVITGALPQQVLIRASGQTLANYDVSNVLADTVLTIYTLEGDEIATNTNWGDAANATAIAEATVKVGAFVFPSDSTDSTILITLDPGAYTAQISGNGGATGNAIVEVYGVD